MAEIRTREALIESLLPDSVIEDIIVSLRARVAQYGDVQAARVLFEFRYGKNPEPPNEGTTLEQLMQPHPLAIGTLDSE